MAFNFSWSPLTADEEFYAKARDLLTKALNKSPKPPIIVDDILVSELNLGTVPPDLEILEIGDLAEDRFRGIFKMCYSGDAFLTLKTRVQANPLNTYLDSKPSFTSPKPLAAASGLTIPLSITLSEIKLSAFIILVFSKQKGLTLVFRNDPLESLKVSSTFDSIQFVRDYLQRTIEQQLRNLMMDELPAIIHRLSLQLWCPDQANKGTETPPQHSDEEGINPFASPPEDPVDINGNVLDANSVSDLALYGGVQSQSLFSQRNLLRLATLTDSHRTLSLFTPGIRDVVFRAWSVQGGERSDPAASVALHPGLTRTVSVPTGASTTYTFSDSGSNSNGHLSSRPSSINLQSVGSGLALGSNGRARTGRKRKNRVVNLRRSKSTLDVEDVVTDTASETASIDAPFSEPLGNDSIPEEREIESLPDVLTPGTVRFSESEKRPASSPRHQLMSELNLRMDDSPATPMTRLQDSKPAPETVNNKSASSSKRQEAHAGKADPSSDTSSEVLEHAWISKMAGEIAKRVYDEKSRRGAPASRGAMWEEHEEAPPAYEAAAH